DPGPAGRLLPGEVLCLAQGPPPRPGWHPGADHRVHLRRPEPAGLGRGPSAVDDLAGPGAPSGLDAARALSRAARAGDGHRRAEDAPAGAAGAAEPDPRRGGAGAVRPPAGPLPHPGADAGGSSPAAGRPAAAVVHGDFEDPAMPAAGMPRLAPRAGPVVPR